MQSHSIDWLDENGWCAYVLAARGDPAFKVGFTSNPLQRMAAFSPRFFETFDLTASTLSRLEDLATARAIERDMKRKLAPYRATAPSWVSADAGGATEWFESAGLPLALELMREVQSPAAVLMCAYDFVAAALLKRRPEFELWACAQADELLQLQEYAQRGYRVRTSSSLHCWLEAYDYFETPLFEGRADVRCSVSSAARRAAPPAHAETRC